MGNQKTPSKLNCLWSLLSVWEGRHPGFERVLQWFKYWTSSLSDFSCSQHEGRGHGVSWWTHLGNRKTIFAIMSSSVYEAWRHTLLFWFLSGHKQMGIFGILRQFRITLERSHIQILTQYSHLLNMWWRPFLRNNRIMGFLFKQSRTIKPVLFFFLVKPTHIIIPLMRYYQNLYREYYLYNQIRGERWLIFSWLEKYMYCTWKQILMVLNYLDVFMVCFPATSVLSQATLI